MADGEQNYSIKAVDGYIHLKTWGPLSMHDLETPAEAALALSREQKLDLLLDDIRDIDTSGVNIAIQTKAMGILWKLRSFRKVAIILKDSRIRSLFVAALEALHLNIEAKFKGFDNEADAIAWLKEG